MIKKSVLMLCAVLACVSTQANAGFFKDRFMKRDVPPEFNVTRDVHYGAERVQSFDIYAPENADDAPAIIMVHGGGWKRGDKTARGVVDNKISHWVSRGYVFISVNYRMLPETGPLEQARDIGKALGYVQRNAADWGIDPTKIILMGHSAGAHLVALLSASPGLAYAQKANKWRGTVALDSAAMNVDSIMRGPHMPLYDTAFGKDQGYWQMTSPYHQVGPDSVPIFMACSTRRQVACDQANEFKDKVNKAGGSAMVLPLDLSHGEINSELGLDGDYTAAVDKFLRLVGVTP